MLGGEDHGVVWDACSMITTFTIDAIQKHVWIIMFFTCITPVLRADELVLDGLDFVVLVVFQTLFVIDFVTYTTMSQTTLCLLSTNLACFKIATTVVADPV